MPRRIRRPDKEILEKRIKDTEVLGAEILATNKKEEQKEKEMIKLGPDIFFFISKPEGLKANQSKEGENLYLLQLSKNGKRLSIWLQTDNKGKKEVSIGSKDYRIKEDKLVELAKFGILDLVRREIKGCEFTLERRGEEIIIDLNKIKDNDELNQFLSK